MRAHDRRTSGCRSKTRSKTGESKTSPTLTAVEASAFRNSSLCNSSRKNRQCGYLRPRDGIPVRYGRHVWCKITKQRYFSGDTQTHNNIPIARKHHMMYVEYSGLSQYCK